MIARALRKDDLCPEIEGEGKMQRFCGLWSKNCPKWLITALACMKTRTSVVGFYDAMSNVAVDFIVKQTGLKTIFCTKEYIKKVLDMKESGMCEHIDTLVSFDGGISPHKDQAKRVGVQLQEFDALEAYISSQAEVELEETQMMDTYIFSYTSGTTGDSKGVKLNHKNILSVTESVMTKFPLRPDNVLISYLPYPHSFEQCMLGFALVNGAKIGYFQGDPAKIT